jgi:hypothetical protein
VASLKLDHDPTDDRNMRDDEVRVAPPRNREGSVEDFSFVVFSLTHAECGQEGVIEVRLGERLLLEWCPSCATLETFGSFDG